MGALGRMPPKPHDEMKLGKFNPKMAKSPAPKSTSAKKRPPLHPGEVLREEFLVPLSLSPGALAKAMGVPRTRVERIAA
jgi:hypothetical protein